MAATVSVLAELEARAGASDNDRPAWLAERRAGITATEIRDLHTHKISQARLIAQKLTSDDRDWVGRWAAWGKDSEPIIADILRGEGFEPESRVFHHATSPRHLASPDGIRVDFDEQIQVSEIKTAATDLEPGSFAIEQKGYEYQCQWVMYVLGANRCRFVVEERIELPDGSFQPGALHRHWIDRDEQVIAELVAEADAFLAEMDRQRDAGGAAFDDEIDTFAVNVLRFRTDEADAKKAKETAWSSIIARMPKDKPFSQKSAMAQVTWTPVGTTDDEEFDVQAAKDADPALFAEVEALAKRWNAHQAKFKRTVPKETKGHLTVSGVKGATK
jgi:hypothetical protein